MHAPTPPLCIPLTCSAQAKELYCPRTPSSLAGQTSPEKKDVWGLRDPAIQCSGTASACEALCAHYLATENQEHS